jgi:sterol desaturase/sphingolipid hydroxylase (fatty acid hydroxylase superfamily)
MKIGKLLKIIALPAAVGLILWLEKRRPLRREVESKAVRRKRNLLMVGMASAAMALVEQPVINKLTAFVERKRFGLLKIFKLPRHLEILLAFLLLDYTLYLWHVSTHKVPFLWRFHLVHHVDLDLDSSTAYRFHFGEILISVIWRAMQILLIGASPEAVKLWQKIMLTAVLFHHSNLRLPDDFDEKLSRIIITPKLHGIHHSAVQAETDSNWSTILSVWDRLHGTWKTDVKQDEITIGVPAFQNPQDVELVKLIKLPFVEQRPSWQLSDGQKND